MNLSIIGSGKIVTEALPVIAATPGITIRSIFARTHSLPRARQMAATFAIPVATDNYTTILADPLTEVVYIALINSVHFPYALSALQAGKHVILEKPACLHSAELQQLADEAQARHLMLFEAVTLLHLPAFDYIQHELLPQIGTIRHIECNYSQRSSRLDSYLNGEVLPAFDPEAGGGALMDINVYNIHFTLALLGTPEAVHYECRRGYNGIDLSGTVVLRYPDALAICTGSKDSDAPSFGLIQGDNGWIRIDGPVSTMASITLGLRGHHPQPISLPPVSHRLAPEFAHFIGLFRHRDHAAINRLLHHSIAVSQTLDIIRDSTFRS